MLMLYFDDLIAVRTVSHYYKLWLHYVSLNSRLQHLAMVNVIWKIFSYTSMPAVSN